MYTTMSSGSIVQYLVLLLLDARSFRIGLDWLPFGPIYDLTLQFVPPSTPFLPLLRGGTTSPKTTGLGRSQLSKAYATEMVRCGVFGCYKLSIGRRLIGKFNGF